MKKQGFTLIEVLAVIVVLSVIALITTPIIINVIEKAKKGALEDSAYGLLESANIYYASGILDETNAKTEFTFKDGMQTSENKLSYKGKVENGSVRLYSDGKTALCITGGEYAALKNVNDKKVSVTRGRCSYNTETEEYETRGLCQDLQDEIGALKKKHQEELDKLKEEYEEKLKQAGADKEQIIKDYEDKIKTITDAYEAQIKELQDQLSVFKNGGTATADQILSGKTAFVKGQLITETMVNRGAVNGSITTGKGSYTIPAGYHNGSGKITVDASAIAAAISNKGVATDANASFQTMADNINKLNTKFQVIQKTANTVSNNTLTISFADVPGYQNLTINNFYLVNTHITFYNNGKDAVDVRFQAGGTYANAQINSYNNSNGVVTVSVPHWGNTGIGAYNYATVACIY